MSEVQGTKDVRRRRIRHKGRASQILIYLGKQIRFFINENDWKVLPMAAIIAALVGMVIRKRFFINMEGSLIGGFALTCVAIWNGAFNSIQSVCRERAIIKREHRSGMHVSSYVVAHMIYQFVLCLAQTGLTMYVLNVMGVQFPSRGFMTPWMIVDIGISMLLITYASDMLSLFLSSIARTTTGAMTVMPFVLIFQLVFSGGIIPLPAWSQRLSDFTISNYGIRAMASQSGYNELPMVTVWNTLSGMRNSEVGGTFTVDQIMDILESPAMDKYRDKVAVRALTVGEVYDLIQNADQDLNVLDRQVTYSTTLENILTTVNTAAAFEDIRNMNIFPDSNGLMAGLTVGLVLDAYLQDPGNAERLSRDITFTVTPNQVMDVLDVAEKVEDRRDEPATPPMTVGYILDRLKESGLVEQERDRAFTVKFTIGDIFDMVGEERIRTIVQQKTAEAGYKPEYAKTEYNIMSNCTALVGFVILFALLSILVLERIDKDKR